MNNKIKNSFLIVCLSVANYIFATDNNLINQAIKAAKVGDMIELKKLLGQGVSPDTQEDQNGKTLLELVIEQPDKKMVENNIQLIEMLLFNLPQPANPDLTDYDGNTPLIHTIKLCIAKRLTAYDTDAIVQMIINRNARTDIKNKKGQDIWYWINVLKTGYCSDQDFTKSLAHTNLYKDIDLATQLNLIIEHRKI